MKILFGVIAPDAGEIVIAGLCKIACNNGSDSLLMHVDAHLAGSKGESAGG
jgi:ABC-type uncharacterized transport system ATPase subunit